MLSPLASALRARYGLIPSARRAREVRVPSAQRARHRLALTTIYNIYIGLFEHKNCIFQEMLGVGELSADVGGVYRC